MSSFEMMRRLRNLSRDTRGATAIEYALIAAGVSIAIIGGVSSVGGQIMVVFYDKLANLF
ncbi:MAG TPA: Flp family type IVb pilin [Pseudolabrys sp.]|nr:Flp family type IVb pilin [Pseudolabrys sp.]